MAKAKISKKGKSKDDRPARARYWASRTLEERKVKNLMRNGMTRATATTYWNNIRQGRVPDGFLRKAIKLD